MKKIICLLVAMVFAGVLSSCGVEPISCSIGELNCQIPGEYIMEQDQDVANAKLDDTFNKESDSPIATAPSIPDFIENEDGTFGIKPAENETEDEEEYIRAKDFKAVQWFEGDENSLVITALYSPHNNDDLDGALKGIGVVYDKDDYTQFDIDGSQGRHGSDYVSTGTENYVIDIIHNGLIYSFVFFNRGEDMSEEEINAIIESISFDDKALEKRSVKCGDISLKLSGEYQPLEVEETEGFQDEKAYGRFGDARVEFSINYFDAARYKSASEMANVMKTSLDDADYSEIEEEFGKCYYLAGEYEGSNNVVALFDKNDKVFMLQLLSDEADLSIEDMQKIIKTIEIKK